jgi:hypothetical protein
MLLVVKNLDYYKSADSLAKAISYGNNRPVNRPLLSLCHEVYSYERILVRGNNRGRGPC